MSSVSEARVRNWCRPFQEEEAEQNQLMELSKSKPLGWAILHSSPVEVHTTLEGLPAYGYRYELGGEHQYRVLEINNDRSIDLFKIEEGCSPKAARFHKTTVKIHILQGRALVFFGEDALTYHEPDPCGKCTQSEELTGGESVEIPPGRAYRIVEFNILTSDQANNYSLSVRSVCKIQLEMSNFH